MTITTTSLGKTTIIRLEGNLMGGPDANALNAKVHELAEIMQVRVVLDLGRVQFMNSSGLGLLIGAASMLKNAGGALKIAGASEKILALIKVTKLSGVLETFPTVDGAAASFGK